MAEKDPEEQRRILNTLVVVCANGHPAITYYRRRDQPDPGCPLCHPEAYVRTDAPADS